MSTVKAEDCSCLPGEDTNDNASSSPDDTRKLTLKYCLIGVPILVAWWLIYTNLLPFAGWLARHLVELLSSHFVWLGNTEHLTSAVEFFFYDTPKVLMLLILGGFWSGHHPFLFYPGTHPQDPCREA